MLPITVDSMKLKNFGAFYQKNQQDLFWVKRLANYHNKKLENYQINRYWN